MKCLSALLFLSAFICPLTNSFYFFWPTYLKHFKNKVLDVIDLVGPKDECSRHLKAGITDLFVKKLWALKMFDASGKLNSGYMSGNIHHFGHYDQCLSIKERKNKNDIIEAQYCIASLVPSKNATKDIKEAMDILRITTDLIGAEQANSVKSILKHVKIVFGICIPKSCSADRIQKLFNHMEFNFRLPVHITVDEEFCIYQGRVPYKFEFDNIIFWIFGLYFTFICFASLYSYITDRNERGFWKDILKSFSFYHNIKKIFDLAPKENENKTFSSLNGLKALSMVWIIFGHTCLIGYMLASSNPLDYFQMVKKPIFLIAFFSYFAVDTFFVISGLLLAYKYLEIKNVLPCDRSFPYVMYYVLRFIRLWPALLATILFYVSVLKHMGDGPLWPIISLKSALVCQKTAWATAIFATNFIKMSSQCIEQTWYVAIDTQLYCIAPVLLYLFHKNPRKITAVLIALCGAAVMSAYNTTLNLKLKYDPTEMNEESFILIYESTFIRMPSWILGILTGGFLYYFRKIQLPKTIVFLMWTSVAAIFSSIGLGRQILVNQPYNEHYSGIYNAAARPAWAIAICFIIVLCATNNGGIINQMLSYNIYKPLVRISYSVYLIHVATIILLHGSKRSPTRINILAVVKEFLANVPFVMVAGCFWCLAFESPFINILKLTVKLGQKNVFRKPLAIEGKKGLGKSQLETKKSFNKHSFSRKIK